MFGSRICQSRNNKQCYQNEIYDIGTEILTRSRFFTKIIKSFYKSIIPQEIKSPRHPLSSGNGKTRFKSFFKKWHPWIGRLCFYGFHTYRNEIYDIGTEILLLTKKDHNSTQKAPKSILPREIKSAGHSPSSGSVKSRFKVLFKKCPSLDSQVMFLFIFRTERPLRID